MKKKSNTLCVALVGDLCEQVNKLRRTEQIEAYIASPRHTAFVVAEALTNRIAQQTKKLERGEFDAQFRLCCCDDTFTTILAEAPEISYVGCLPGGEDDEERDEYSRAVIRADLVESIPKNELFDFLVNDYGCTACNFTCEHKRDLDVRNRYHKAVTDYLSMAAALAKTEKSPSARLFLEALFLLQARAPEDPSSTSLGLTPDDVEKAFRLSKQAQVDLWIDIHLRNLKPLRIRRGKASKRKR